MVRSCPHSIRVDMYGVFLFPPPPQNSHLLFFSLACEHIIRMIRVLQTPNGHILLVQRLAGAGTNYH